MHFFIYLCAVLVVAYHIWTRRIPSSRRFVAFFAVLAAISAFWSGFRLAVTEDALARYGEVVTGTLGERISTTGEQGTRTFETGFPAVLATREGSEIYEVLERVIATGSPDGWAVNYSYPCGATRPCWARAFVSHERWLRMRTGDGVRVRHAKGAFGGARLEEMSQWPPAIARMAIGTSLVAAAVLIWGNTSPMRRTRRVTALAVVKSVEQVRYLGGSRWRVRFSYLDRDGNTYEGCDEFAGDTWKPGDTGVAVYEPATPDAAGLQHSTRAPVGGATIEPA